MPAFFVFPGGVFVPVVIVGVLSPRPPMLPPGFDPGAIILDLLLRWLPQEPAGHARG